MSELIAFILGLDEEQLNTYKKFAAIKFMLQQAQQGEFAEEDPYLLAAFVLQLSMIMVSIDEVFKLDPIESITNAIKKFFSEINKYWPAISQDELLPVISHLIEKSVQLPTLRGKLQLLCEIREYQHGPDCITGILTTLMSAIDVKDLEPDSIDEDISILEETVKNLQCKLLPDISSEPLQGKLATAPASDKKESLEETEMALADAKQQVKILKKVKIYTDEIRIHPKYTELKFTKEDTQNTTVLTTINVFEDIYKFNNILVGSMRIYQKYKHSLESFIENELKNTSTYKEYFNEKMTKTVSLNKLMNDFQKRTTSIYKLAATNIVLQTILSNYYFATNIIKAIPEEKAIVSPKSKIHRYSFFYTWPFSTIWVNKPLTSNKNLTPSH